MGARFGIGTLTVLAALGVASAQESEVRLGESFKPGLQYHVVTKVELSGTLTPPAAKGKTAKAVKMQGSSAIEYDERVVAVDKGDVSKTVRVYRKLDFRRTLAGQKQELSLRPAVRRLVVIRRGHTEVPFSPDGPLTWGEIDAVRVDVFTPALAGLLPQQAVRAGAKWDAAESAVQELTDLEKLDQGRLECKLERVASVGRRQLARVSFTGTVKGISEDGPIEHRLAGVLHYDVAGAYVADLALNGVTLMLDKDGKEMGRIEGKFSMTRTPGAVSNELTDAALRNVKTEPDADNTQLLYDNRDLGVRFLHARRWRIGRVSGTQIALDAGDGSGLVITLDPPGRAPTAREFLDESRGFLEKQKAKLVKVYTPARLRNDPPLDGFALEVELGKQKLWMDYYVTAQSNGGATVAARLLPEELAASRKEVDRIARSLTVTKRITPRK